jgi:hypothetical protein
VPTGNRGDRLDKVRIRLLIVVGVPLALIASALGSSDYNTHLGSIGAAGVVPTRTSHSALALWNQAVLPAEAEARYRSQAPVPAERDRALGAAGIVLVRPSALAIPPSAPRRHKAASRVATSPARSPPVVPYSVISIA